MYTLAFSDADRGAFIEIVFCIDEDELINKLEEIFEIPDLYEGMGIDEALDVLDYQRDMLISVSMTIMYNYSMVLYQI